MDPLSTEEVHSEQSRKSESEEPETSRFGELAERWREKRERIAQNRSLDLTYRIAVGVVGTVVLIAGIVAIPYPGPGWLIVFAGLGILASEFEWAHRLLRWVRKRYDAFMDWFSKQNLWVRGLGVVFTCAVVLATLWVLGALGMVASWVGLDWGWLQSPL